VQRLILRIMGDGTSGERRQIEWRIKSARLMMWMRSHPETNRITSISLVIRMSFFSFSCFLFFACERVLHACPLHSLPRVMLHCSFDRFANHQHTKVIRYNPSLRQSILYVVVECYCDGQLSVQEVRAIDIVL
jgi:hypothetical protein